MAKLRPCRNEGIATAATAHSTPKTSPTHSFACEICAQTGRARADTYHCLAWSPMCVDLRRIAAPKLNLRPYLLQRPAMSACSRDSTRSLMSATTEPHSRKCITCKEQVQGVVALSLAREKAQRTNAGGMTMRNHATKTLPATVFWGGSKLDHTIEDLIQ